MTDKEILKNGKFNPNYTVTYVFDDSDSNSSGSYIKFVDGKYEVQMKADGVTPYDSDKDSYSGSVSLHFTVKDNRTGNIYKGNQLNIGYTDINNTSYSTHYEATDEHPNFSINGEQIYGWWSRSYKLSYGGAYLASGATSKSRCAVYFKIISISLR